MTKVIYVCFDFKVSGYQCLGEMKPKTDDSLIFSGGVIFAVENFVSALFKATVFLPYHQWNYCKCAQ